MYEKALAVAKEAAILAGEKILEYYYSDFEVEYKSDDSPLTCADRAADEVIQEILLRDFPEISILSEESSDDLKRLEESLLWVVDPLDGTKEFIHHTNEFTVNIALVKDGHPVVGVVYVPVTEELYYASIGNGSFYEVNEELRKNRVSDRTEKLRLLSSKYHKSDDFLDLLEDHAKHISSVESVGSSLKGCMIARGIAEAYYRFGYTSEWDTAAVQLVAEEAGGVFRQLDHTEMTYNRVDVLNRKGFYIVNKEENILVEDNR
jgi:3'(2'), 5'-bisphosphate nucleotidase